MLISKQYREEQTNLHKTNPNYGVASIGFAPMVGQFIQGLKLTSVLDYGAGKGNLAQNLKIPAQITEYDPAIPGKSVLPEGKFDLVCCIDVLEHIEPECLFDVLDSLTSFIGKYAFITVHTGPAKKVLSDGRNAHLIQEKARWWMPQLCERMDIQKMNKTAAGFLVLGTPLL